jgi:DNA-binding CsgD family transcriptional regulator
MAAASSTAPQGATTPSRLQSQGRGPADVVALHRRLRSAGSIPELLREASEAARGWCGFSRALLVAVEGQTLNAEHLGALPDPASDSLRRRLLAAPVELTPGTAEAELIRRAEGGRGTSTTEHPSALCEALSLSNFAFGCVVPEERVIGLLVVDRDAPEVGPAERAAVELFAWSIGVALERLFLRVRLKEFAIELRHLTASAHAAMHELLDAPVSLPSDFGAGLVFATAFPPATGFSDELRELLTARELQVAEHLVAGRSNREIASALHLSPETVKAYVARVLRKLGAANRADAVARYLRLATGGSP